MYATNRSSNSKNSPLIAETDQSMNLLTDRHLSLTNQTFAGSSSAHIKTCCFSLFFFFFLKMTATFCYTAATTQFEDHLKKELIAYKYHL